MTADDRHIDYYLNGAAKPSADARNIAFQVYYGDADFIDISARPAKMGIAMQTDLFPINFVENWYGAGDDQVTLGSIPDSDLHFVEDGDNILIFGQIGRLQDIETTTQDSYTAICEFLQKKGFRSLVRFWNFIPEINGDYTGTLENYRAFCKGRASAFGACGVGELQMPAATGIGSHSTAISGYLVASKAVEHLHFENPLQKPAYKYPRRFGPKSPSFARGTMLREQAGNTQNGTLFFLSGTASIRQSETMWPGDIDMQVQTMMENVQSLISAENVQSGADAASMTLADFEHFKVYFRRPEDYPRIRHLLTEVWALEPEKLFFMNVDICRADLLVEVEGCINSLAARETFAHRA